MSTSQNHPPAPPAHSYTVELRFTGDGLDPAEFTRRLNLQPHSTLSASDAASSGRRRRPFWAYNGRGRDGFQPEWESLEQGLAFLLVAVSTQKASVLELAQRFEGVWWCGHFQASFDGGPMLSAKLLSELGTYGLPLFVDNYFTS